MFRDQPVQRCELLAILDVDADRALAAIAEERFERLAAATSGIGSRDAASPESPETEKQRNRRVSFHLTEIGRDQGAPAR